MARIFKQPSVEAKEWRFKTDLTNLKNLVVSSDHKSAKCLSTSYSAVRTTNALGRLQEQCVQFRIHCGDSTDFYIGVAPVSSDLKDEPLQAGRPNTYMLHGARTSLYLPRTDAFGAAKVLDLEENIKDGALVKIISARYRQDAGRCAHLYFEVDGKRVHENESIVIESQNIDDLVPTVTLIGDMSVEVL